MKAKIEANGNTIEIESTEEQAITLGLKREQKKQGQKVKRKTGWERSGINGGIYYYICLDGNGEIGEKIEQGDSFDDVCDENGNYFTSKELAEKMGNRIRLMLRMQRWADEHNDLEKMSNFNNLWNDERLPNGWNIIFDRYESNLTPYCDNHVKPFDIYFSSRELAEQAIEVFKDELKDMMGINGGK